MPKNKNTSNLRFEGSLWCNLDIALRNVDQIFRQSMPASELSVIEIYILRALFERDGQHASELARAVGRAATSFTPNLDKLQKKDLIERRPDPNDRRAVRIYLTSKAEELRDDVMRTTESVDGRIETAFLAGESVPILIGPTELARPRLVTQMTVQDALVINTGLFPDDGRLFDAAAGTPAPAPDEVQATPAGRAEGTAVPTAVPERPNVISLAVSPQDAVVLTHYVEAQIPVSFALCPANETGTVTTQAVTLDFVMTRYGIQVPRKLPYGIEPAIRSIRRLLDTEQIIFQQATPPPPPSTGFAARACRPSRWPPSGWSATACGGRGREAPSSPGRAKRALLHRGGNAAPSDHRTRGRHSPVAGRTAAKPEQYQQSEVNRTIDHVGKNDQCRQDCFGTLRVFYCWRSISRPSLNIPDQQ